MKIEITQEQLTDTIEAMRDYLSRLEQDAAAIARLPSTRAHQRAELLLAQAETVSKLFGFFLRL